MSRSYPKDIKPTPKTLRLKKLSKSILLALGRGGVLAVEAVFYLADGRRNETFSEYLGREYGYSNLYYSTKSLERQGLVRLQKRKKGLAVKLTRKGLKVAEKIAELNVAVSQPSQWDKVWRVIAFDIPESQRAVRDALRDKIRELGFVEIQKSLFVIPWPCRPIIKKIQDFYFARKFIKYMEVKRFDGERDYKKIFGLSI